jgi:hypothetical protein
MKPLGFLLFVAGLLIMGFAFSMDTTLEGPFGRIHNVGLLNDRQNRMIAGGFLAVLGAIFLAVTSHEPEPTDEAAIINALIRAIAQGDSARVKALLTPNLNVEQTNEWGGSPIEMAKSHGRDQILAILLEHQAARTRSEAGEA